ncbi:hypothetical protein P1J78_23355 [Psychromarinibacter sp. C21-152]|uniref:Uncharacterized protein n=1 Tax=Psychromarinibacter sediminicola TaxID=3033385 RepID=A0AAE3TC76_9RHOB|nr:DUF6880 family protein [Psychromarinibacter sediminicola]MDF0603669.1 hypothetical protein [Psychromarinibacter sediminicola]
MDAFIAQYEPKTRRVPAIAARIAARLLAANRAEEALTTLEDADTDARRELHPDWHRVRLDVLEALGRAEEAQAARWASFEKTLSEEDLRAYLKRLPDFDDLEAEERALDHAMGYASVHSALAFLVNWPAPERAAALVLDRAGELDGDFYEVLTPASEVLSAKHPLTATVLLRAMIDFSLDRARSKHYRHAARHFLAGESLAGQIGDYGNIETHATFIARLRKKHGRKHASWSLVD